MRLKRTALVGILSIAMVTAFTAPVTAAADGADDTISESALIEVPMTVTAINDEVARKAGNTVVVDGDWKVLYDGRTGEEIARVPVNANRADPGDVSPQNVVTGQCGTSYYWLKDKNGEHNYEFATGFDVRADAYDFHWKTYVRAEWESGAYTYEWEDDGPQVPGPSWTSGWVEDTTDAPPGVWHYGRVTLGEVFLNDGTSCASGLPNEGNYVR